MKQPNAVRGAGPLDNFIAGLRHGIAYKKLKKYQPIESCLDIGSGNYPVFLINLQANAKYGVEQNVSPRLEQVASDNQFTIVEYNLESNEPLPFEDDFFEVVTMIAVIEHIEPANVSFILSEIHRVLKTDGVLFMTTPAAWTDIILRTMAKMKLIAKEEIDDHKDTFTRKKISKYLQEAGFGRDRIDCGTFECFMNLWASCQK